ncbi:hypothetical protein [Methanococcus maripaludis]|uniref:Uncharacterized protein n=1 Tax=Methanococcus maripaludis TaxID=39152 RepID=A0A7J9S9J0_METMI|nr:hypothetical protein [Methanococcus maripaludis]MBB6495982.1 hypothetical protein [Methanococcus maripaludis]
MLINDDIHSEVFKKIKNGWKPEKNYRSEEKYRDDLLNFLSTVNVKIGTNIQMNTPLTFKKLGTSEITINNLIRIDVKNIKDESDVKNALGSASKTNYHYNVIVPVGKIDNYLLNNLETGAGRLKNKCKITPPSKP